MDAAATADTSLATNDVALDSPVSTTNDGAADGPATKVDQSGDYSGTYNFTTGEGEKTNIALDSSKKSYSYTGADGQQKTGAYTVDKDGYRIKLMLDESPAFFVFSNGKLVRLRDNVNFDIASPVSGDNYERDGGPVQGRAPELGSPIPTN